LKPNRFTYRTLIVFLLLTWAGSVMAQDHTTVVVSDARLDSLIDRTIEHNKASNGVQGYRVQIFFGSERKAANDAKTHFLQLMPDEDVYFIYQQPYFKVRVGNYRTRLEAEAVYRHLLNSFDKAFIVPDKISLPKL
jgi:hypothetical protein